MAINLSLQRWRRIIYIRCIQLCTFLLAGLPCSIVFADDQATIEVREIEFGMEPTAEAHSVYGLSVLLECPKCDAGSYIDVEVSQLNQDGSMQQLSSFRSYTQGKLEKQFYNLMSVNKKHRFYDKSEQPLQILPGTRYVAKLHSSIPITYFVEHGSGTPLPGGSIMHRSRFVKWFTQPYTSTFYGIPLSSFEKAFSEPLAYLTATILQFLVLSSILLLAFRKQILASRMRKVMWITYGATAASFILYFVTLCTDHPGGDSRAFQLAQLEFRELHQPGDPILAMTAAVFGKFFPFGNFMYKGHLLAAILSSMAVGLFSGGLYLFSGSVKAAVFPAGVLATGAAFWNYGVIAQNYSMSSFFQALMIFFAFTARTRPSRYLFILACLLSFLMLTTHPTNAYWFFFCALCILPIIRHLDNKVRTLLTAAVVVTVAVILVYLPYILILEKPGYFRPVIVYMNENLQLVERGPSARFVAFSIDGFRSFIRYVVGNSESQSWTGGIASIALNKGIFATISSEWLNPLRVLSIGFGALPALLGIFGIVKLMIPKDSRAIAVGLTLTLLINFVINICEILYFRVGYVEIFVVHMFPVFFALSIGMAALLIPSARKPPKANYVG